MRCSRTPRQTPGRPADARAGRRCRSPGFRTACSRRTCRSRSTGRCRSARGWRRTRGSASRSRRSTAPAFSVARMSSLWPLATVRTACSPSGEATISTPNRPITQGETGEHRRSCRAGPAGSATYATANRQPDPQAAVERVDDREERPRSPWRIRRRGAVGRRARPSRRRTRSAGWPRSRPSVLVYSNGAEGRGELVSPSRTSCTCATSTFMSRLTNGSAAIEAGQAAGSAARRSGSSGMSAPT